MVVNLSTQKQKFILYSMVSRKVDEGGHFVGGISDPQWAIFADDGAIGLTEFKPIPL